MLSTQYKMPQPAELRIVASTLEESPSKNTLKIKSPYASIVAARGTMWHFSHVCKPVSTLSQSSVIAFNNPGLVGGLNLRTSLGNIKLYSLEKGMLSI